MVGKGNHPQMVFHGISVTFSLVNYHNSAQFSQMNVCLKERAHLELCYQCIQRLQAQRFRHIGGSALWTKVGFPEAGVRFTNKTDKIPVDLS